MFFLIDVLMLALLAAVVYWLITLLPFPANIKQVITAIFIVIIIIWLIGMMFGYAPMTPHFPLR